MADDGVGVKPIKSTISVDDTDDVDYFALCGLYNHQIKQYVAAEFKKEITDLDVLNFAMFLCYSVVTAETDDEKADILKDIATIVNDKYRLNEYLFCNLATIKAWNETAFKLFDKKEVSETEFDAVLKRNVEINQYKAWNDERKILDIYSGESNSTDGGDYNG